MAGMNSLAGGQPAGIQTAIAGLKAKLGGGRQPIRGIPTGGMVAGPDGRLPINSMPPLALGGAPSGVRGGPPAAAMGPTTWGGATAAGFPPGGPTVAPAVQAARGGAPVVPSQFDRDAAATGMWRGAARFGKPVTDAGAPSAPGAPFPNAIPAGAGPGAVGAPPVGIFPPQGGAMQSIPGDVGQNQVQGGAPMTAISSPALQAAIAKQQQLKAGYGALLQGALRQNPLMTT